MAALPFPTTCRHSNSPLQPNSKSSFTGFSHRNNIWQLFVSTKTNSRRAIRKLCVKNVASDKKEELKEPLTEQGFLLASYLTLQLYFFTTLLIKVSCWYIIQDINVSNLDSYTFFFQLALHEIQFWENLLGLIGH